MLEYLIPILGLVLAIVLLIVCTRCRGCKHWARTTRVAREDGFLVTCLGCGYQDLITWEDLH